MTITLFLLYGGLVLVAFLNLLLMRRPSGESPICFEVLIPARNEEKNLPNVIPPLISGGATVTVFDDDSADDTAEIAERLGARVIRSESGLPLGWTGKNRACDELSAVASAEWAVFLDADTIPNAEFVATFSHFLATRSENVQVVSGFPKMLPGAGLEPAYLGWVPWILLATNSFWRTARTGKGRNGFTNGQVVAWRLEALKEHCPFLAVKGEVLEDVKIGRLLGSRNVRVEIANLSGILSVSMYRTLREAVDGMSKNSGDIGETPAQSLAFACVLVLIGWGWVLGGSWAWALFELLLLSKFLTDRVVRSPLWTIPFMPLTCLAAALTVLRSLAWKRKGALRWKGRTYP